MRDNFVFFFFYSNYEYCTNDTNTYYKIREETNIK